MSDRCDIVAYDLATGEVTGILAHNIKGAEAASLILDIYTRLIKEKGAEIVQPGQRPKGSVLTPQERLHERLRAHRHTPHRKMQYANPRERQAAFVCIACESPNLVTMQHCESCAAEQNARTTYTARREQPPNVDPEPRPQTRPPDPGEIG